jgi:heptosyltransferase-3
MESGRATDLPRRALLVKLRHIGDALLGTAVASALKAAVPGCPVTYLVPSGTEALLSLCPDLDAILTVQRRGGERGRLGSYAAAQWELLRKLRLGRFDLVLDLGGGDRSAFLTRISGAPRRIGTVSPHETGRVRCRLYTQVVTRDVFAHTVQQDLDVLRAAGFAVKSAAVRLHLPESLREQAAARLRAAGIETDRPWVVVHATSRWAFKTWPEDKLAACVTRIAGEGVQVAVACGPDLDEVQRFTRIVEQIATPVAQFPGTLTLPELAAILAGARAFLGVDSAPAHLAAALGVPSVVLFGPTGAYNWGPWVPTPERTPYPVTAGVQAAGPHLLIQQDWLCVPCGMAGCLFSKRSDCLEIIQVDDVFGAVMACLSQGAAIGAAR